jgi:hypothetical protein
LFKCLHETSTMPLPIRQMAGYVRSSLAQELIDA